eukprot:13132-Pyramimonas_sp.AAC.1
MLGCATLSCTADVMAIAARAAGEPSSCERRRAEGHSTLRATATAKSLATRPDVDCSHRWPQDCR